MATKIEIPECVRQVLALVYPDMNLDGVSFYDGLPFYAFLGPGAITVGPNVYFRKGRFDPCSCKGIALMVHELYHIRQGAGGPGFWFLRPYYIRYAWLFFRSGFGTKERHPLEKPAYDLEKEVENCCLEVKQSTGQDGPCRCQEGAPPEVNQAFLDGFAAQCAQLLSGIE